MATIKDIARLSGFGVGTVSRVLNGGARVKAETRRIILDVADKEGYVPNKTARSLSNRQWGTTTMGVALPYIVHPFYMEIVKGIYEALEDSSLHLILFNLGQKPAEVYRHIIAESPRGLLVIGEGIPKEEQNLLKTNGILYAYLDYYSPDVPCFYNDNTAGGRLAAAYLAERGVNRPCYIGEMYESQQQQTRFNGFCSELAERGIREPLDYRVDPDDPGIAALVEGIQQNGEADGFFFFSDKIAYGGLPGLSAAIPFIGYDDEIPSRYLGISSIRQPAKTLGKEGAFALLQAEETGEPQKSRVFAPELVVRQ